MGADINDNTRKSPKNASHDIHFIHVRWAQPFAD
jgi:hypothetical protein